MFKKVKRYLKNPYYALGDDMMRVCPKLMSDKYYIKVIWKQIMGYPLDLRHPKTFNEKLQWMKLYDRNPLYTDLVDKYKVKQWVADRIGAEHVIPTLAVYDSVDEIDISQLPDQFVLKCNHDSGGVVICKDKSSFDFEAAKAKLKKSFEHNFYWDYREWPYKNVKRKIFAEKFMKDVNPNEDLLDYKLFTFNGEPKIIEVDFDRFKNHKRNIYDTAWNYIEAQIGYPNAKEHVVERPDALGEMLDLSRKLAQGMKQVRTDFYLIDSKVYFGEMTLIHGGGTEKFMPEALGLEMGEMFQIVDNQRFVWGGVIAGNGFVVYLHGEPRKPDFGGLKDYKFFCFHGEPRLMYIANDKAEFPTTDFFDMDFSRMSLYMKDPQSLISPQCPIHFDDMKRMAATLSAGLDEVRVDFYDTDEGAFFGEMTFFHSAGLSEVHPLEWNLRMGSWIELP